MEDGIIKGTGNSRYMKSVADFLTRYPNYEAFAQALMTGTLPFDLNGINPEGWTQQGTPLNKANLLTDLTAEDIGIENATPDDALYSLSTMLRMVQETYLDNTGGAMTGTMEDPNAAQVRNITVSDQNLEAGVSDLATGELYLVFE